MLHQNAEKSKQEKEGQQRFMGAMKTLGIAALLKQSDIRKESRKQGNEKDGSWRSVYELFKMLLLLVFQGENLFRFLSSDKGGTACSKNSYYRFLEDRHANWNRFVMQLAARVITCFSGLTRPDRVKMFVLVDSVIPRERSKKMELLSHVYDHVRGKTVKGFNLLVLGWTDGFGFVPAGFRMLASADRENEYIVILSTDTDLSDAEIVRLYGSCWSIKCCFKVCKSLLKLGKEFHGVSYDLTVSSTALVFIRYILLEWIRRQENDGRTLGELVYCVFDEVRDMELADSLRMLSNILLTGIRQGTVRFDEAVRVLLMNWFCSQPRFIQSLFRQFFSSLDSANSVPA